MLPPPPRSTLFPYTTLFRSVLMAAFEDANPCFLKEIFGACLVSGDVDEVAEQPVLILLDQAVEKIGVAALQAARDGLCFIGHQCGEEQRWTGHCRGTD